MHTKTRWRKGRHASLDSALYGKDGAAALFARRVRIDYEMHGEPLYVVIWDKENPFGLVVKKDEASPQGTVSAQVPIDVCLVYENNKGASLSDLEAHFLSPEDDGLYQKHDSLNDPDLAQAEEGATCLREHLIRERSLALSEAKKRHVLSETGRLVCEACGFDFALAYGPIGEGFCEVHHLKPLAARHSSEATAIEDLAVLCCNCHSIIHRTSPMWDVKVLAEFLEKRARGSGGPFFTE